MIVTPRVLAAWVLLTCVWQANARAQGPPPANVVVDAVRDETVEVWRQVTGEVLSLRRSRLAAEEPGVVTLLDVLEGDRVEAGEVIARLDTTLAEIAVEAARADVQAREGEIAQVTVELGRSERDLARFSQLSRLDASNETELDRAQTEVLRLKAQLQRTQADLLAAQVRVRDAQERVADMTIRAPFRGHVTRKSTEIGQWLARGDPVVELTSLDEIEARLDVPERFLGRLREGETRVRVIIDAMREHSPDDPTRSTPHEELALVTRIVPDADPLTRQFVVRVPISNASGAGRPGMSVVGFVPEGEIARELTIHRDAILRDDAGEFVFMDAGGQALAVRIRTKFVLGERVAIAPGQLRAGSRVVVEGNERLFATQPLVVVNDRSLDRAPEASSGGAG